MNLYKIQARADEYRSILNGIRVKVGLACVYYIIYFYGVGSIANPIGCSM